MRHWIFGLLLFIANPFVARAEPFERAEVTKAINVVSLLPRNIKAVPGDVVSGDSALKTGDNSRAELEFPDLTITRVGSNALFRFLAGGREMTLDGGTMLFSSPEGAGGGKVQAGAITAAVTGTDFLISRILGRIKVICLSGKVLVYFTANPKLRVVLKPGQMVDIPAGATKMPPIVTINLGALISTSVLINMGPLRSQPTLERNASNQQTSLLARFFPGVNDLLTQTGNQAAQMMTTQAGQTARLAGGGPPPPPPPAPPLLLRQLLLLRQRPLPRPHPPLHQPLLPRQRRLPHPRQPPLLRQRQPPRQRPAPAPAPAPEPPAPPPGKAGVPQRTRLYSCRAAESIRPR